MARGRLLRTKVREEKALARARLEGERQFYNTQKGGIHWFKKILAKVFSSPQNHYVIDIPVFCAGTYLCYQLIDAVDELASAVLTFVERVKKLGTGEFWVSAIKTAATFGLVPAFYPEQPEKIEVGTAIKLCLAVCMAYILIFHPEVVSMLAGGLVGFGKILVGA